jgi:uncharacterized membrane protein YfcA
VVLDLLIFVAAVVAGGVASVAGFGIGSILTPVFALVAPTNVAVAAVSIPHLVGTALRFALLRTHVDRRVVVSFGLTSAAGGLTGALLQRLTGAPWLTVVFGLLLLFTSASEMSGISKRLRFRGAAAWVAGAVSGMLGGLVGNQGGIRSAALLGFDVPKEAFVASATAVGLIVDGARMPVYYVTERNGVATIGGCVILAAAGVVVGTLMGRRVLTRIPEPRFRTIVAVLIGALGAAMAIKGLAAM